MDEIVVHEFEKHAIADAVAAQQFCERLLHHYHRGVLDCDDKYVVYCNGRYEWAGQLAERMLDRLSMLAPADVRFSGDEDGYWAIVIYNYARTLTYESVTTMLTEIVDDMLRSEGGAK